VCYNRPAHALFIPLGLPRWGGGRTKARWLAPLVLLLVVGLVVLDTPGPGAVTMLKTARSGARPILGSRKTAMRQAQAMLDRLGRQVQMTSQSWLATVLQVRQFQVKNGIRDIGQESPLTKRGPLTRRKLLGRGSRRSGARPASAARLRAASSRPARARAAGVVYLSFDDGPDPTWTPKILAMLVRYRARATFFVLGRSVATWPWLVRREVAAGHGVGNHTWNHRRLPGLGGGGLAAEVGETSRVIGRASGARVRCLRPPYGVVDAASAARVRGLGLRLVLWDVDSNDYLRPGAGVIAARVLGRVRSGDVVLFHDGGGDRSQTVAALDQVLAALSARGFRFGAMCRG
jgi:peptidoglycan/xylan/chitin deacetylase (PgdA/CDA1 family)